MEQEKQNEGIGITLHCPGEEGEHIKLIVGDTKHESLHLSLRQARALAVALIQQVHRAEVSNNLRKSKQRPAQTGLERTSAKLFTVPHSQQA